MLKFTKIFSLLIFTIVFFSPLQVSANTNSWYWISSDSQYSKYFSPKEVKVVDAPNGIPTQIQDYIKTSYSPAGAAETVKNMKLNIKNPTDLSYSIAKVWVNPQNRTIRYMEETFYNKSGKALYKNIPLKPRQKSINSQSFDEKFYTYIVDQVYHQGETKYLNNPKRWLTIWDNNRGDNAADTSTMYQVKDRVTTWLWANNKTNGKVTSITFAQKEYDLKNNTLRTLQELKWTPDKNWQTTIAVPDSRMREAKKDSDEGLEFAKIRAFALKNPIWTYRYQPYNPALKKTPHYAVKNQEQNKAPETAEKTETSKTKQNPAVVNTKTTNKTTAKTTVPKTTANPQDEPLGTYGPIGPVTM